ncbi:MAG: hypothetical protein Q4F67_09310 [Propionibacteriaceae bacterium]|nr:hypothetical protein [Propionibacteriaceae bacterium]
MRALQVIYSFFLGLALVAFVGIGVDTFYPRPKVDFTYPTDPNPTPEQLEAQQAQADAYAPLIDAWNLNTSIILLVIATAILIVALVLPERLVVLSNGMLLGGLFTLFYAVVTSWSNEHILRFVVIAIALTVTVVVGWRKFRARPVAADGAAPEGAAPEGAAVLENRVAELEQRFDALRKALGG